MKGSAFELDEFYLLGEMIVIFEVNWKCSVLFLDV